MHTSNIKGSILEEMAALNFSQHLKNLLGKLPSFKNESGQKVLEHKTLIGQNTMAVLQYYKCDYVMIFICPLQIRTTLLPFSETHELCSSQWLLRSTFFASERQPTNLEKQKQTKWIEIYQSQHTNATF